MTQAQSLPSNETYFIFKDSKGFLWIATDQGVVKCSGTKMERVPLPHNVVFKIKEDRFGRIWFFPKSGILSYYENGRVKLFRHEKLRSTISDDILITDAFISDDMDIYVNSATSNNYILNTSGKVKSFNYKTNKGGDTLKINIEKFGPDNYFASINHLSDFHNHISVNIPFFHKVYNIAQNSGPIQFYGSIRVKKAIFLYIGTWVIKFLSDGSYLMHDFKANIYSIHQDGNNIWIALQKGGALLLDENLNLISDEPILKNLSVSSIEIDNEGGIWFATLEKGVFYNKSRNLHQVYLDGQEGKAVSRIYVKDNQFLYATTDGVFQNRGDTISSVIALKNVQINDMFINSADELVLVGVGFESKNIDQINYKSFSYPALRLKKYLTILSTNQLFHTKENEYYYTLGITLNNLQTYPERLAFKATNLDNLPFQPRFVFKDQYGFLWLGGGPETVRINLDSNNRSFKTSAVHYNGSSTCMADLTENVSVIGLRFGGLLIVRNGQVIDTINKAKGLIDNSVKTFLLRENQLWVATPEGISVVSFSSYSPLKYRIKNIGRNIGLYNLIIKQLISFKENILIATTSGILKLENPESLINTSDRPIPLYIEKIKSLHIDTSNIRTLALPYKDNSVTISFTAVCFNSPKELKYHYRIKNEDSTWRSIESSELILNNLAPGKYQIELRASLTDEQRFSEVAGVDIVIAKPWWQNNWLRFTGLLLLIALILLAARGKVISVRKEEQEKLAQQQRMSELEQTALRAQMNPHLIFNCLTSIQQLIVSGKNEEANDYLVQFAALIRKTLEFSSIGNITLRDEVNYLKDYLSLEQLRLPDRFTYQFHINPELDQFTTKIPHMMLQPILENSIRHGIKPLINKPGKIDIDIIKEANCIKTIITDNGVGREFSYAGKNLLSDHKSFGINILEKRLEGLEECNGIKSSIEVIDLKNDEDKPIGTRVILIFPYKNSKA